MQTDRKVESFWSHEASNIRCVREADYCSLEQECERLQIENEALAGGLKGKHSLVGATYARITEQRDAALKQEERLRDLLKEIRPTIPRDVLELWCADRDAALSAKP